MKTRIFTLVPLCFLLSPLLTTQAKAQTLVENVSSYCSHFYGSWYFTSGVGGSFPIVGYDNKVGTGPGWPKDYYSQKKSASTALFTVGSGLTILRYQENTIPYISVGLAYTYAMSARTSGTIKQYSLPEFINYNYKYNIQRQTLLAMVKADIIQIPMGCTSFMPYLSAGVGASWNRVGNYEEHHLGGVTPRVSPGFQSNVNTYFAYSFGAGVDFMVQNNFWVSLDYNYGSYGYARTGNGANTKTVTGSNFSNELLRNKLTANNVLISITGLLTRF